MSKDKKATTQGLKVMTSERWKKLEEIYNAALPMSQSERHAFLERASDGDTALRQEAEALLAAYESADGFLQDSIFTLGMQLMTEETRKVVMNSKKITLLDDRYEILGELGSGGMGKVYKARDTHVSNRFVVVKVLKEEWLKNEWIISRFKQEAAVLSKIDDPGVVGIIDVGVLPNGQPYLVMQYVKGSDLSQSIQEAICGMDFADVAEIIKQVGRTLTAAHDAAVIHRDLKPGNIMACRNKNGGWRVKIIDFGIAKVKDAARKLIPVTDFIVGTPLYMAPEQMVGSPVTPASDVYALGVIAYEMLTGRIPFNSENLAHLLELKKSEVKVQPKALRPGLPEAAERAVLKALSCDPTLRQQSADRFGDELAQALTLQTSLELPPPPLPALDTHKRWIAAMIAAVTISLILVGVLWWRLSGRTLPAAEVVGGRIENNQPPMDTPPAKNGIYDAEHSFPTEALPEGMVYASIGITVYRLRPLTARDGADTAREIIDGGAERVAERIKDYIRADDQLLVSIESLTSDFLPDKSGYLYVVNREQYADSSFGHARLIFPTLLTYGGNNRIKPGQPIVLPRAKGEPFNIERRRSDQVSETLTILFSPQALQLPQPLGKDAIVLPDDLIANWQKQYSGRMYSAELSGGIGQSRTKKEKAISEREVIDSAESLTQDEALPQIVYKGVVKAGNPVLITVVLRFKG